MEEARPEKRARGDFKGGAAPCVSLEFQFDSLRISASKVAALTGYNPFVNLPQLICDLTYQGRIGQLLLKRDANLLGLQLVSEEEIIQQLASKAGAETLEAVKQLALKKPQTREQATEIKKKALQNATNLSKEEKDRLKEHVRSQVDTQYGTRHEKSALDAFELQKGCSVTHRNEHIRILEFDMVGEKVKPRQTAEVMNNDLVGEPNSDDSNEQLPERRCKCFFSILGSIDGMYDEPIILPKDQTLTAREKSTSVVEEVDELFGDDMTLRPVVLECKHRLRKLSPVPPLYEQLQAVIYCFLYGTDNADILQVLRTSSSKVDRSLHGSSSSHDVSRSDDKEPLQSAGSAKHNIGDHETHESEKKSENNLEMSVYRVSLEDPVMQHRKQWESVVLPRIQDVVQTVYGLRRNDHERYQLLALLCEDPTGALALPLLNKHCPWLVDCECNRRPNVPG